MYGIAAGAPLPSPDGDLEIARIELDPNAGSPGVLGSDQGRTRPEEGIEHEIAAAGDVFERVNDHQHRLHRWVHFEQLHPISAKAIDAAICPNIGARAAVLAQLKVVEMRRGAKLQHEDEFVLRAIESPHPRVRFGPNADVFEQELQTGARPQQL